MVCAIYEKYRDGYTLTEKALTSVRLFIGKLGVHEVIDAMERAYSGKVRSGGEFKYFCGICWNKIREIS